jgi:mannosyltransferase OCH1-like enzyme
MIPKIIHQIWIGDKLPPLSYMNTWKIKGYKYMLWNEEKIFNLNLINQDKYDYFLNKKIYYGAADIARIEILNKYGGLYIDADTIRLKDLPEEWFNYDFFAVKANDDSRWNYRITNGIIGSKSNSSLLEEYINSIKTAIKITPCWNTIGGTMLTNIIVNKFKDDQTILILEPYTFYPVSLRKQVNPAAHNAYGKHIWGSKNKKLYKVKK